LFHRSLDLNGYLHIKGVLQGEALTTARAAAVRYAHDDPATLPPPFSRIRRECDARVHQHTPNTASQLGHAFAFDKSLEHIVFQDTIWPIIHELTDGRPQLNSGGLVNEDHRLGGHGDRPVHLHCAREDGGPRSARFEVSNGRIYCDNFIVFPYFDDVHPGDGGLLVLPGSHKSNFERPHELYGAYGEAERRKFRQDQYPATGNFGEFTGAKWHDLFGFDGTLDDEATEMGMRALTPKAGDVLIMPEALTHGVLPWLPTDRARHAMLVRFSTADRGAGNNPNNSSVPPEIFELLSPETQELTQSGGGVKKIAARRRPLEPEEGEAIALQPYNSTPPPGLAGVNQAKL
jgi:hypothetical protein